MVCYAVARSDHPAGAPSDEKTAAMGHAAESSAPDDGISGGIFDRWGQLMMAGQDGDERAYDQLFRELDVWLHRYYRRRMTPTAADDAVQETLLAIHSRRCSYRASGPFGGWLVAIARYKWMDHLRAQYRDGGPIPIMTDIRVDDHGSATRSAILVDRLLDRLKPAQADVIRMMKLCDASVEEASRMSGQSPALVKVNVHRGLKKIASLVEAGEAVAA